jgi:hypothetical protein
LRHRGRAVEDSIRHGKDTGMRNLPHHAFEHNQTWLELSLTAQDLLTWTKLICLTGKLATAEPKRLRHRLLHTAGRIVRHGRRTRLRRQATGHGHVRWSLRFSDCERSQRSAERQPLRRQRPTITRSTGRVGPCPNLTAAAQH